MLHFGLSQDVKCSFISFRCSNKFNINTSNISTVCVLQVYQTAWLSQDLHNTINQYGQSCTRIILLVPSGSQTPICYVLHSFVLHLAPAVLVLQLLKSGTLSLRLFECVPAMILSAINSRPTTSSWPSNPLSASSLVPQIRLWLTIVRVYKLYLLTYLLTIHLALIFCFSFH